MHRGDVKLTLNTFADRVVIGGGRRFATERRRVQWRAVLIIYAMTRLMLVVVRG